MDRETAIKILNDKEDLDLIEEILSGYNVTEIALFTQEPKSNKYLCYSVQILLKNIIIEYRTLKELNKYFAEFEMDIVATKKGIRIELW
jgi:hypothetical protein